MRFEYAGKKSKAAYAVENGPLMLFHDVDAVMTQHTWASSDKCSLGIRKEEENLCRTSLELKSGAKGAVL